jgi:predicted transporter
LSSRRGAKIVLSDQCFQLDSPPFLGGISMPEFKSLLLGLVFALGMFSVKSGCGISYLLSARTTLAGKAVVFAVVTLTYLGLFLGSWYVSSKIDLISHFNSLKTLFGSGMVLHVLIAGGTLVWAVSLLRTDEARHTKSFGWIALVVPCPVCASVIFFVTGFLVAFFPDNSFSAVMAAYAVYLVITLLTIFLVSLSSKLAEATPERTLGLAMLFVSAYFLVSVLVAPHFGELERIYRIARHTAKESPGNPNEAVTVVFILVAAFATGFVLRRIGRRRKIH